MDATAFVADSKLDQDAQELAPMMQQIQQENPVLQQHPFHVRRGNGPEQYQSEFYSPWSGDNPAPGMATIELYNPNIKGQELKNLMLGETFHHLGSVDPKTGNPVDPKWFGFKQQFLNSLTPDQISTDLQDYGREIQSGSKYDSIGQYYQQNRLEAYFRGGISPMNKAEADDWGRTYTPEQKKILEAAKTYLKTGGTK
jgi:hypothetical protein